MCNKGPVTADTQPRQESRLQPMAAPTAAPILKLRRIAIMQAPAGSPLQTPGARASAWRRSFLHVSRGGRIAELHGMLLCPAARLKRSTAPRQSWEAATCSAGRCCGRATSREHRATRRMSITIRLVLASARASLAFLNRRKYLYQNDQSTASRKKWAKIENSQAPRTAGMPQGSRTFCTQNWVPVKTHTGEYRELA